MIVKFSVKSIFQELLDVFNFRAKFFQVQKIFTIFFFDWKCSETYPKIFWGVGIFWRRVGGGAWGLCIVLYHGPVRLYSYCWINYDIVKSETSGVWDTIWKADPHPSLQNVDTPWIRSKLVPENFQHFWKKRFPVKTFRLWTWKNLGVCGTIR